MTTIIGLTGGIGSGKSSVSAVFAELNVPIIDADSVSRSLTGPGAPGSSAVADLFGPDFLTEDSAMDRKKMRELVFSDPSALKKLENILHPMIAEKVEEAFRNFENAPFVIYDCPLLYRPALRPFSLSRTLVVDATDETRFKRILTRPQMTEEIVRKMMKSQPSRETFLSLADDIILNEGSEEELRESVKHYYEHLCHNLIISRKFT